MKAAHKKETDALQEQIAAAEANGKQAVSLIMAANKAGTPSDSNWKMNSRAAVCRDGEIKALKATLEITAAQRETQQRYAISRAETAALKEEVAAVKLLTNHLTRRKPPGFGRTRGVSKPRTPVSARDSPGSRCQP